MGQGPPDVASPAECDWTILQLFQYAPAIVLTLLVLEYVSHLDIEIACIWRRPFTHVKLLYVVARYVGLASAIASEAWISHSLRAASVPWDTGSCKTWLLIHVYTAHIMHLILLLHVSSRVYALFAFDKYIRYTLTFLVLLDFITALCITTISVRATTFTGSCEPHSPSTVQYYAIGSGAAQLGMFALTLYKRWSLHAKASSGVVNVVTRDGGWTFGVIATCLAVLASNGHSVDVSSKRFLCALVVFCTPPAFSCVICRLVLNVQSLHVSDENSSEAEPNGVELTSAFTIDEMGTISKGASLQVPVNERHPSVQ
ncbi:hypothetical protein EV714DRAFT_243776 [Schizophyllum commune]